MKKATKQSRSASAVSEFDIHVGARIKERREVLGLSIEELAALSGQNAKQLEKCEQGEGRISAGTLFEVAKNMGKDISFFYAALPTRETPALAQAATDILAVHSDIYERRAAEIRAGMANRANALALGMNVLEQRLN